MEKQRDLVHNTSKGSRVDRLRNAGCESESKSQYRRDKEKSSKVEGRDNKGMVGKRMTDGDFDIYSMDPRVDCYPKQDNDVDRVAGVSIATRLFACFRWGDVSLTHHR